MSNRQIHHLPNISISASSLKNSISIGTRYWYWINLSQLEMKPSSRFVCESILSFISYTCCCLLCQSRKATADVETLFLKTANQELRKLFLFVAVMIMPFFSHHTTTFWGPAEIHNTKKLRISYDSRATVSYQVTVHDLTRKQRNLLKQLVSGYHINKQLWWRWLTLKLSLYSIHTIIFPVNLSRFHI